MKEQCPPWPPPSASRAGTEGRAVETAGKAHRLNWRNPAAQSHGTTVSAWHFARGAMSAGLQSANCGKPQDAKVGPSPQNIHGNSAAPR